MTHFASYACICTHFRSEHDLPELGGRCRTRHYRDDITWEPCDCPGFEADPHQEDDDE